MNHRVRNRDRGLALVALCVAAAPVAAQGVTYTTVSKPEMGGAMGMMARFAPGATAETRATTYVQGSLVRSDEGEERSTIADMAEGRYTFLDHTEKTFYTVTFEEMAAQAQAVMGGAGLESPTEAPADFQVERTGKTRDFDGYTAEQVLMIMTPTAASQEAAESPMGAMTIVSEIWFSRDFPGHEAYEKAQEAMAAGTGGGMAAAFQGDPGMTEGTRRITEEMKGLDGVPVRTVTSMVMVPPGSELDLEAVLAASDKPLGSEGGGAAAAAAGAARQALGGLLGRRRQQEQPAPDEAPAQNVFMRVTQTVQDVRVGDIPAETFEVPAGYRESPPVR